MRDQHAIHGIGISTTHGRVSWPALKQVSIVSVVGRLQSISDTPMNPSNELAHW